eukprot:scaffold12684_cov45-Cyclotella_meneghiniana.AAC.3
MKENGTIIEVDTLSLNKSILKSQRQCITFKIKQKRGQPSAGRTSAQTHTIRIPRGRGLGQLD